MKRNILVVSTMFSYLIMWNIYFFYNDKLAMHGQNVGSSIFEFAIGWLGIILHILPLLASNLLHLHPFATIASTLWFAIISASIIIPWTYWLIKGYPRIKTALIILFLINTVLTTKYAVRDYFHYQEIDQYGYG